VITASRPMNKNVRPSTGAVIRTKPGSEPGVHGELPNGFVYKFRHTNVYELTETQSTHAWQATFAMSISNSQQQIMRYKPVHAWLCLKKSRSHFLRPVFGAFCGWTIHPAAKVFDYERTRTNRNLPARNTLVQLLVLTRYADPESHNAQRYRQTDR